ncbi:MAG: hypothetical protein U0235_00240 [Polyangiaceae bacterium]
MLVEPFIFNSCQWQSTETISGDLATQTLNYDYAEKPLAARAGHSVHRGRALDLW